MAFIFFTQMTKSVSGKPVTAAMMQGQDDGEAGLRG